MTRCLLPPGLRSRISLIQSINARGLTLDALYHKMVNPLLDRQHCYNFL